MKPDKTVLIVKPQLNSTSTFNKTIIKIPNGPLPCSSNVSIFIGEKDYNQKTKNEEKKQDGVELGQAQVSYTLAWKA